MGRFNKGLFFGGLFGAASMWLVTTKKGKKVREQMLDTAAVVYEKLEKDIQKTESYEKLTKARYVKLVKQVVEKYAIKNGLADDVKRYVTALVSSQWKNARKNLR